MTVLVLADVHANRPALDAVLAAEPDRDSVLFLGDAVDYGPHLEAVVDCLSELSGSFVMGNHDRDMLDDAGPTPPRGRGDFTQWTRSQLSESDRQFLAGFEETAVVPADGGDVRLRETRYDAGPTAAAMEELPVDEEPTIWRRCLKRELFRLRRDLGRVPDDTAVAAESRYELAHYREEFGSLDAALVFAGLQWD